MSNDLSCCVFIPERRDYGPRPLVIMLAASFHELWLSV